MRRTLPTGEIEELMVIVDSRSDEETDPIKVQFRVYLVDKELYWRF